MFLSDVCLSVAYIAPNTRKRGLGRLKIGTEVRIVQVTRDSDTTFKVKRSRSPGHAIWLVVLAGQHTYSNGDLYVHDVWCSCHHL